MATTEEKARRTKQAVVLHLLFDNQVDLAGHMLRRGVAKDGSPTMGIVDYNWKLLRDGDGRYEAYVEWVDLDGEGHRVVLPNGVLAGFFRAREALAKASRKAGAAKAVETRASKGVIDLLRKKEA